MESDSQTHTSEEKGSEKIKINSIICFIGASLRENKELIELTKTFRLEIVFSNTGQEWLNKKGVVFILEEFEGEIFENLNSQGKRILSPIALRHYHHKKEPLPLNQRPLYNLSYKELVVCFNGYKKYELITRLINTVHYMGGSVRKDFSPKVTHLITNVSTGEKYRYAASVGVPILKESWLMELWENRHDFSLKASEYVIDKHRLPSLFSCKIGLIGHSEEDFKHIEETALQHGAIIVYSPDQDICTHLVSESREYDSELMDPWLQAEDKKIHIVSTEWFWASILLQAIADEFLYRITTEEKQTPMAFSTPKMKNGSSSYSQTGPKRRRIHDRIGNNLVLKSDSDSDFQYGTNFKRRSSEMGCLSISASLLDTTFSPDNTAIGNQSVLSPILAKSPVPSSKRHFATLELISTERNYVAILDIIDNICNDPNLPNLIKVTEIKSIFGNLTPIREVHKKLQEDLYKLMESWTEESEVGSIILKYAQDFKRAYPPFINFHESIKEMLKRCEDTKPRFHAFLKQYQSKKECNRQTLFELMIRPIQRLPSIMLLLSEILKYTPATYKDHNLLEQAIATLKEVMTYMNEDRKKTEGQFFMFEIVNDIDNCPASLLSSNRSFDEKVEVLQMGEFLSSKGDILTIFLFSDVIEICKKRNKVNNLAKSPSTVGLPSKPRHKSNKHLLLLNLAKVQRVIDVQDADGFHNAFTLVMHHQENIDIPLLTFILQDNSIKKVDFLKKICRNVANVQCRTDADSFLWSLPPVRVGLIPAEPNTTSFSNKAMSLVNRTGSKINKAICNTIKRTPSKKDCANIPLFDQGVETPTSGLAPATRSSSLSISNSSLSSRPILKRFMSRTPTSQRRNRDSMHF